MSMVLENGQRLFSTTTPTRGLAGKSVMTKPKPRVFYHITMQPHRRLPALYAEVETLLRDVIPALARGKEFSDRQ